MRTAYSCIAILSILIAFNSCGNQATTPDNTTAIFNSPKPDTTDVPVALVKREIFFKQTFSNGSLEAAQKVEVAFQAQGTILEIAVRNGDYVNEGQLLASLDDSRLHLELAYAGFQLKRNHTKFDILSFI